MLTTNASAEGQLVLATSGEGGSPPCPHNQIMAIQSVIVNPSRSESPSPDHRDADSGKLLLLTPPLGGME